MELNNSKGPGPQGPGQKLKLKCGKIKASFKPQASSNKRLDKLQAVGYNRSRKRGNMNKKNNDPFGFNKAINREKLNDPKVLKELENVFENEEEKESYSDIFGYE